MSRRDVNIKDFNGFDFEIEYSKIIEKNAKELSENLKTKPQWKRHRQTKSYNAGWKFEMYKDKKDDYAVVHNETSWQLTWLLEHGHLITNKKGGVGYARGKPHIRTLFYEQMPKFINEMEKDIEIIDNS